MQSLDCLPSGSYRQTRLSPDASPLQTSGLGVRKGTIQPSFNMRYLEYFWALTEPEKTHSFTRLALALRSGTVLRLQATMAVDDHAPFRRIFLPLSSLSEPSRSGFFRFLLACVSLAQEGIVEVAEPELILDASFFAISPCLPNCGIGARKFVSITSSECSNLAGPLLHSSVYITDAGHLVSSDHSQLGVFVAKDFL